MQINVLIEPLAGQGFRAQGGEPFALNAEGRTREEALQRLQVLIQAKLQGGAQMVTLEVPDVQSPWPGKTTWFDRVSGSMKDDPEFAKVLQMGAALRAADRPIDEP